LPGCWLANMTELEIHNLLDTDSLVLRNIVCQGTCRHRSPEETAHTTHLVFPYRGVYVRHVGRTETVAEANQVVFFNQAESYRISHPVQGGDACLSLSISDAWLSELAPKDQVRPGAAVTFQNQRRRIDPGAQSLVATLRHALAVAGRAGLASHAKDSVKAHPPEADLLRADSLEAGSLEADSLEAESLVLALVRRCLGERTSHGPRATATRQRLADRAKLVLSSDLGRRWSLSEIASEVGVSPVYLTQVFQQVEAMPLYRYQLRMRLARALDLLDQYDDLAALGLELGFSSHSHFSAAFRQAFGRSPAQFQRAGAVSPARSKSPAPRGR
jgi:AraC-like DNA-binding protein